MLDTSMSPLEHAQTLAEQAKAASPMLACSSNEARNRVLTHLARLLKEHEAEILEANAKDLQEAEKLGLSPAMMDRLRLTEKRIDAMVEGVQDIIALEDPLGHIENAELSSRPNGLQVGQIAIPIGVICIIFESRPNVTIDAGALCIKSGNTPILKAGKEAFHSHQVLVQLMRQALSEEGFSPNCVQAVATSDRQVMAALIRQNQAIDLLIPRGGEGLIRYVTENASIPVIQHFKGVCHIYVHEDAKLDMATAVILNAKCGRPGVCNALETLLVHENIAPKLYPLLAPLFAKEGVEIRADLGARPFFPGSKAATSADWDEEYLAPILAIRTLSGFDEALEHIRQHGSNHTESILTENQDLARRFINTVDASCVMHNSSTRFNDGFQLGLGAEIGISTSKLHAYGPMGLKELTTKKFVVLGQGQIRP